MSRAGDAAGFAAYKSFALLVRLLPRPFTLALGRGLGRLAYRLDKRHREIALANLAVAFGSEKSPAEREAIARTAFANAGRTALDTIKFTGYSADRIRRLVDVEGGDHLRTALATGRGVLVFTAHFGNWEASPSRLSEFGAFHAIARTLDNRLIDRDLLRLRRRMGAAVIDKMGAGRPILKALAKGGIVALVVDQNVLRSQAVFVDFFGKTAATTPGLAAFHLKTGAPMVPFFCVPRGRRYLLRILPPLTVPRSDRRDADVLKTTQIYTKMIEQEIRREPGFWLWIHKRWNTRPADETKDA
ncbi:MAG: lysophospholipid acyltransferase family protein [Candidatus Aminicenantes bacterium]|nr:lysophospholipid acyltransferase family protein [Candidatus Aminicenantes bacterium]